MSAIELRFGDLFAAQADAIGHGTNTHGLMGAGIAVPVRKRHPEMYERYRKLCAIFGDDLAGHTQLYFSVGESGDYRYVANIFSQKAPGPNADVDLLVSGVRDAFAKLYGDEEITSPHLAIPLIGCGIGGLDWDTEVYPALVELMEPLPPTWLLTVVSNEEREGFVP